MAQQAGALLAHFRMTERDVDYGVVAAVRILDTLRMTSPSVGGPIDLYRRWSELEDAALDQLFAGCRTR